MTGRTHLVGGIVLGIIVARLIQLPNDITTLLIWYGSCGLGGLLCDIDHPNSLINKYTLEIPYVLTGRMKHRTFTHSILFSVISLIITLLLTQNMVITIGLFVGIWSHLLLDMLNPTGVPYLYPFNSHKYSIMRVHTGTSQEIPVIIVCLAIGYITLFPSEVYSFILTMRGHL